MPIYSFQCPACGETLDDSRSVDDRRRSVPCKCGGIHQRIPEMFHVDTFEPYYDEGLGADVGSRMERRVLMKQLGVIEAGDRVGGARNWEESAPHTAKKVPPRGVRASAKPPQDPVVETVDEQGKVVERARFSELPS